MSFKYVYKNFKEQLHKNSYVIVMSLLCLIMCLESCVIASLQLTAFSYLRQTIPEKRHIFL